MYTIIFWGTAGGETLIPEIQVTEFGTGSCWAFSGGSNHEALVHTVRDRFAFAASNDKYVALKRNSEYFVRVSAQNDQGYGYATVADKANTVENYVAPSRPTSISVGDHYTGSSMELRYAPPV